MIKPDQRQRIRRISQLHAAADVIEALRGERPELCALYVHHDICTQLRTLAAQYEAKPLPGPEPAPLRAKHQRVAMSRRRPIPTKPIKRVEDPLGMTRALRDIQGERIDGRHVFLATARDKRICHLCRKPPSDINHVSEERMERIRMERSLPENDPITGND